MTNKKYTFGISLDNNFVAIWDYVFCKYIQSHVILTTLIIIKIILIQYL